MTTEPITLAHGVAGGLALCLFWTAAALRKGTPLHRRIGLGYMGAMIGVLVTTPVLAFEQFARGNVVAGTFLSYLIVITATAAWLAWRAIRRRRSIEDFLGGAFPVVGALNFASGLVVLAIGVRMGQPVLLGMSLIGIAIGVGAWRQKRSAAEASRRWWLRQHYGAIVGCGIATHIAFLSIGLQRILPAFAAATQYLAWFGPVLVAIVANRWLDRRYGFGPDGDALTR